MARDGTSWVGVLDGEPVERGDEHDRRHPLRSDRADHFDPVHFRHLDVEDDEVKLLLKSLKGPEETAPPPA